MLSGAGHRWQYGASSLHAGYLRLQIHTLRLRNTNCLPNTTTVARTRLNVPYIACLFITKAYRSLTYTVPAANLKRGTLNRK
jgi:hypothetical protein